MTNLALRTDYAEAVEREWLRMSTPGTWLDGHQRVAVARQARAARAGIDVDTPELTAPMVEVARRIGSDAASARHEWVESLVTAGLGVLEYIEILGVVSRISAIDTFLFGIGQPERPLPSPLDGEPSRVRVEGASVDGAWVPTVGRAGAPNSLSAVAGETEALLDIHTAFYLSIEEMGRRDIVKDLQRDQLEVIAARTSLLNDCFY